MKKGEEKPGSGQAGKRPCRSETIAEINQKWASVAAAQRTRGTVCSIDCEAKSSSQGQGEIPGRLPDCDMIRYEF